MFGLTIDNTFEACDTHRFEQQKNIILYYYYIFRLETVFLSLDFFECEKLSW